MDEKAMLKAHQAFVAKYQNHHFYAVFPITAAILLISLFGLFGNANIVWASYRRRSLRSNCNLLIAAAALSDVLHQLAHFILGYEIFSGNTFITLEQCFWYQVIPIFGMNFGTFIVMSIGLDRLFSVLFPMIYKQLEPKWYILFMLSVPAAFSFWMTTVAYYSVLLNPQTQVICVIAEAYHIPGKELWLHVAFIVNLIIIVIYSLVWVFIKLKNGRIDKRIMRSLTVIMFLVLFGWFTGALGVSTCIFLGWDEEGIFKAQMYFGTLINLSISLNYPVYMIFCKSYKVAFLDQLKILTCRGHLVEKANMFTVTRPSQINPHGSRSEMSGV